jgi:predicted phage-related endonuclease
MIIGSTGPFQTTVQVKEPRLGRHGWARRRRPGLNAGAAGAVRGCKVQIH